MKDAADAKIIPAPEPTARSTSRVLLWGGGEEHLKRDSERGGNSPHFAQRTLHEEQSQPRCDHGPT